MLIFLVAAIIACMLPLTGCSDESKFSTQYEITNIDSEQRAFSICITVVNEGNAWRYQGAPLSAFGYATLTSADGKEYQLEKMFIAPVEQKNIFRHGEQLSYTYTFQNITDSGVYTLSFQFLGMTIEIPDIYISFTE